MSGERVVVWNVIGSDKRTDDDLVRVDVFSLDTFKDYRCVIAADARVGLCNWIEILHATTSDDLLYLDLSNCRIITVTPDSNVPKCEMVNGVLEMEVFCMFSSDPSHESYAKLIGWSIQLKRIHVDVEGNNFGNVLRDVLYKVRVTRATPQLCEKFDVLWMVSENSNIKTLDEALRNTHMVKMKDEMTESARRYPPDYAALHVPAGSVVNYNDQCNESKRLFDSKKINRKVLRHDHGKYSKCSSNPHIRTNHSDRCSSSRNAFSFDDKRNRMKKYIEDSQTCIIVKKDGEHGLAYCEKLRHVIIDHYYEKGADARSTELKLGDWFSGQLDLQRKGGECCGFFVDKIIRKVDPLLPTSVRDDRVELIVSMVCPQELDETIQEKAKQQINDRRWVAVHINHIGLVKLSIMDYEKWRGKRVMAIILNIGDTNWYPLGWEVVGIERELNPEEIVFAGSPVEEACEDEEANLNTTESERWEDSDDDEGEDSFQQRKISSPNPAPTPKPLHAYDMNASSNPYSTTGYRRGQSIDMNNDKRSTQCTTESDRYNYDYRCTTKLPAEKFSVRLSTFDSERPIPMSSRESVSTRDRYAMDPYANIRSELKGVICARTRSSIHVIFAIEIGAAVLENARESEVSVGDWVLFDAAKLNKPLRGCKWVQTGKLTKIDDLMATRKPTIDFIELRTIVVADQMYNEFFSICYSEDVENVMFSLDGVSYKDGARRISIEELRDDYWVCWIRPVMADNGIEWHASSVEGLVRNGPYSVVNVCSPEISREFDKIRIKFDAVFDSPPATSSEVNVKPSSTISIDVRLFDAFKELWGIPEIQRYAKESHYSLYETLDTFLGNQVQMASSSACFTAFQRPVEYQRSFEPSPENQKRSVFARRPQQEEDCFFRGHNINSNTAVCEADSGNSDFSRAPLFTSRPAILRPNPFHDQMGSYTRSDSEIQRRLGSAQNNMPLVNFNGSSSVSNDRPKNASDEPCSGNQRLS